MCARISARALRAWRRVSREPAPTAGLTTRSSQACRARNASSTARGISAGLGKVGRHHRQPGARQVPQVVLVGVPAHHRRRIQQLRARGRALHPGEELRQPLGVVPRRAQQRQVEALPLDLRVVPVGDLGRGAGGSERREQRRHVLIQAARRARAHQRDGGAHSRVPVPRFMRPTATANSTTAAPVMSAKAAPTSTSETPRKP